MKLTPEKKIEFIKAGYITKIQGSEYIKAHGRIILFRDAYPEWGIRTDIIKEEEGKYIIMKAEIFDDKGMVKADGIRFQRAGESFREKCQTCAISRALANLGIGIEFGVAGAEEMIDFYTTPEGQKVLAEKKAKKSTPKVDEPQPDKEYPLATDEIVENTVKYLREKSQDVEKDLNAFKQKYGRLGFNKLMQVYNK